MSGTVLITGAGARIGAHLARGLAADGWTVIIHYNRSKTRAEELVAQIDQSGGKAYSIGANLSVPSDLGSLVAKAANVSGGQLTALINNASTFDDDHTDSFTRGSYNHHMDVNLYAPIKLAQDFTAQLPDDHKGCIINMIDQQVLRPEPNYFTYAISKAALHAATKTLAQSLAPNIRVNAIGPGPTLQNKTQTEAEFSDQQSSTLLGTGSPPDTILQGVRYLLAAEAVTGQMIAIDGGEHLG